MRVNLDRWNKPGKAELAWTALEMGTWSPPRRPSMAASPLSGIGRDQVSWVLSSPEVIGAPGARERSQTMVDFVVRKHPGRQASPAAPVRRSATPLNQQPPQGRRHQARHHDRPPRELAPVSQDGSNLPLSSLFSVKPSAELARSHAAGERRSEKAAAG